MSKQLAKPPPLGPDDLVFSVKPRLLTLLGEQLIRDASLAVFELVKNAYDADATKCTVTVNNPVDQQHCSIVIKDNGSGMSESTLRNAWMVIGTDFRAAQRTGNQRSPRFHRFPLGEKGLGRLSIHKLGRKIKLVTRVRNGPELVLEFNWTLLEQSASLNEAVIKLQRREPITFSGGKHGTKLTVTDVRETWTRGQLRYLHRAVNSLCSPYKGPSDFDVELLVPDEQDWLANLLTADSVSKSAIYHATGWIEGTTAGFEYKFTPPPLLQDRVNSRSENFSDVPLSRKKPKKDDPPLDLEKYKIGRVEFEFRMFDRDKEIVSLTADDVSGLKKYLDENGGIRIFRDGIRVYDFGEQGNDWLNLDQRRINTPTVKISNNQILGALRLDATASQDLQEKSNREGFITNKAYEDFCEAVRSVLTDIEAEKSKDQKRIRKISKKGTGEQIFERLTELRSVLDKKGMLPEVSERIDSVEKELVVYRDQLLHAAVPGLSMGMMLHGAEKILEELREAARRGDDVPRIKALVDQLYRAMRPVTSLLKNAGSTETSAAVLIKEAIFSVELRLKRHGITLVRDMGLDCPDFKVKGSKQMLVASLNNLIDNAIHWIEIKQPNQKLLYIGRTAELEEGPAILVADNGPGFRQDLPEDLVAPFFTRRDGGMGLGLYIVNEVMKVAKGELVFPRPGDVELPPEINGAVVALRFPQPS